METFCETALTKLQTRGWRDFISGVYPNKLASAVRYLHEEQDPRFWLLACALHRELIRDHVPRRSFECSVFKPIIVNFVCPAMSKLKLGLEVNRALLAAEPRLEELDVPLPQVYYQYGDTSFQKLGMGRTVAYNCRRRELHQFAIGGCPCEGSTRLRSFFGNKLVHFVTMDLAIVTHDGWRRLLECGTKFRADGAPEVNTELPLGESLHGTIMAEWANGVEELYGISTDVFDQPLREFAERIDGLYGELDREEDLPVFDLSGAQA